MFGSNKADIEILGSYQKPVLVSLKWYRCANRYNNGTTRYGNKYRFHLIISWAKDRKIKSLHYK